MLKHITKLDTIASLLGSGWVPSSISRRIWERISQKNEGKKFFYEASFLKEKIVFGGVCGLSDLFFKSLEDYEDEVSPVLQDFLLKHPSPVILDVGTNIGQYLIKFKVISKTCQVHCFEPFPKLVDFLSELVRKNNFPGITINRQMVGSSSEPGSIYFHKSDLSVASSVKQFQPRYDQSLVVGQTRLDDYVRGRGINKVSLIKIDVEGGELEVLEGAKEILEHHQPALLLELLYTKDHSHLERQEKVVGLLKGFGYQFYHIGPGGNLSVQTGKVKPDPNYRFLNYWVRHVDALKE